MEVVKKPPVEKTRFEVRQTCYDCKFSDVRAREDGSNVRICRLNPPISAYAKVTAQNNATGIISSTLWTEVDNKDWCGKLEPRIATVN